MLAGRHVVAAEHVRQQAVRLLAQTLYVPINEYSPYLSLYDCNCNRIPEKYYVERCIAKVHIEVKKDCRGQPQYVETSLLRTLLLFEVCQSKKHHSQTTRQFVKT